MYQWNATDYSNNSLNQKKWGIELLAGLNLNGQERVLDIGCGTGELTALIAESVPNGSVIGIDNSPEMIRLAEQNFPESKYTNLSFLLKDASNLDFNDEFNAVFSNACLHWITDHKPVLTKIYKSLKPGGRIVFQMGGKGNAQNLVDVIEKMISGPEWMEYFLAFPFPYGFFDVNEYKQLLLDCGFIIKRLELIPKDLVNENKEQFAGWIRTTWLPYIQRVPEVIRDTFVNEVIDRYLKAYPADNQGFIHLEMKRLNVEAEKPITY